MQMPKAFIIILAIFQAILTFGHWLLYLSLIFFFPWFGSHQHLALISLLVLSPGFLIITLLDFNHDGPVLRWLYIFFSLWVVVWFYLLLAMAASLIIFLMARNANPSGIALAFCIGALALVVYGIINAKIVRTVKLKISLPNLPAYWKNKKAVVVSDLHLGHVLRRGFAEKVVKKINSLTADIVLIPGDVYDGVHADFASLIAPLKNLQSRHGVYFCSGNHELYAGMRKCEQAVISANITILENQKLEIEGLQIGGLAYAAGQNNSTIADVLGSLNFNKNQASILLKHVPAQIPLIADAGLGLMLSGHSHRGQIWPGPLITKSVWQGFDYGLKRFKNMQIYTSSGAGTWGPPVRIFTGSEIIQIEFT